MAEPKIACIHLVGNPNPSPRTAKPKTEAQEIATEVLTVVRNCAQQLAAYRTETEIALGEVQGLLDYLEILALRGLAKR